MSWISILKLLLTPPKQDTIRVRCPNGLKIAETNAFDSDINIRLLKNIKLNDVVEDENKVFSGVDIGVEGPDIELDTLLSNGATVDSIKFNDLQEESPLDVILNKAVKFTGSIYMFLIMWIVLFVWIIWGIATGAPDHWQIVMQDGQSIQTYIWDTLLMRQQLDDTESFLKVYGNLKSRSVTHKRLLNKIKTIKPHRRVNLTDALYNLDFKPLTWFDKLSNIMSNILGGLPAVIIYWIVIIIWIISGNNAIDIGGNNYQKWSDKWQMLINTVTAVELLITSVFLENIRARNNDFMRGQLEVFAEFDSKLELMTRLILDNDSDENILVEVEHCSRLGIKKYISKYSDIIGTGIGLLISLIVFGLWIASGPSMNWNDNWWLIIGTYTGLIGFIDGFVLREVFFSITNYEEEKFKDLLNDSQELLDMVGIETELNIPKADERFINRTSIQINNVCSTDWSVVFSLIIVLILIGIASALKWSTTGQLIANTPTMIIEGFFLLILIQAHNWADASRSGILTELTKSRKLLYNYVTAYIPENGSD